MDLDETMTTSTSSTTPSVLQDIADPDADEGYDDSNLFRDDAAYQVLNSMSHDHRPRTPPANDHLNAAAPGELSPPRSQTRDSEDTSTSHSVTLLNGAHSTGANANISATRSSARIAAAYAATVDANATADDPTNNSDVFPSSTTEAEAGAGAERDDRPGAGWRSKKAQDDMQRAWENIVDRDFSLAEFGDVVLLGKARMNQR